ncbi:MAG: M23 family metallopeptidase [Polyangiaceae bacterium]|nr:M23 family metallopeptidase [Polyangiaceae bacterium]
MASIPERPEPRHVGRVVDPLGLDDAGSPEAEPLFEPAPPHAVTVAELAPRAHTPTRGSAVRARLLERAGRTPAGVGDALSELSEDAAPPADALEFELERVSAAERASPAGRQPPRAALPPPWGAAVAAALGVATVLGCVAVASRIDSRAPSPAASAAPPPPAPGAAAPAPEATVARRARQKIPGPWRIADDASRAGVKIVKGTFGRDAFLSALTQAGVPAREAYRAHAALKGLRNLDRCERSHEFVALLDRAEGRLEAFEYVANKEEIHQARADADGRLVGRRLDLAVERTQLKGVIQIREDGFARAAERAGFEPGLTAALGKALDGHVDLEGLARGDVVRLVVQEVAVLGEFSRYSGVEAVEVRPAGGGEPVIVYWYAGEKEQGWFDANARAPYEGGWRKPIPDAPITSRFNPKRLNPVLKKVMPHNGTDFGSATGTPVGAISFGRVTSVGWQGACGNAVQIEHAGEVESIYCHLSRFAEGLKVGDRVKRLGLIGYVGSTGRSTGPHLHLGVKRRGEWIDPESLGFDRQMRVLPKSEQDAFAKLRAHYDALLAELPPPPPLPPPADRAPAEARPAAPEEPPDPGGAATEPEPGRAPPSPSPPAPQTGATGAAVHLTDEDLLRAQGSTDDGEID